jgi:hypothetical protein
MRRNANVSVEELDGLFRRDAGLGFGGEKRRSRNQERHNKQSAHRNPLSGECA